MHEDNVVLQRKSRIFTTGVLRSNGRASLSHLQIVIVWIFFGELSHVLYFVA
jgi:hypothetical protein